MSEKAKRKKKPEPKVGDVWKGEGVRGDRVRVREITDRGTPSVRWEGVNRNESGLCSVRSWSRKRTLVERDGKAVA